jgi:hypothetical protein
MGRSIAAPPERCVDLLGVDLAIIRDAAAKVEPYIPNGRHQGLEPDAA